MAARKGKRIQRPRIQPEMDADLEQATGLTIAVWAIGEIIPYERNPRIEHDVASIALSIKQNGWTQQIVVDEEGVILAGHGRRLAALRLGLDVAPVTQVFGMTESRKKAYRLMDNRAGEGSGWEKYLLMGEIRDIEEADRALTGFGQTEIDKILAAADAGANPHEPDSSTTAAKGAGMVCPNCGAVIEPVEPD